MRSKEGQSARLVARAACLAACLAVCQVTCLAIYLAALLAVCLAVRIRGFQKNAKVRYELADNLIPFLWVMIRSIIL